MKKFACLTVFAILFLAPVIAHAQGAVAVLAKVKEKLDKVNDYSAQGRMKLNVSFIKAPVANVKVYYKKPDKLRIHNEQGISLVPKGAVNINIGEVLANLAAYDIIDGGKEAKSSLRILKLLPKDDNNEVVLCTLYIDEKAFVIKKARTTKRGMGTYDLEMTYGRYIEYGLADKVIFSFNTKEYKLPKGVTFDYDDGQKNDDKSKTGDKGKNKDEEKTGKVEISYSSYIINKGVPDSIFK
jgi:outer membrane lipoprotein-sorting protein